MLRHRIPLLVTALLLGTAWADSLPSGVVRQGNVITMQPIADSDQPEATGDTDAERRPGTSLVLSASDHELFSKAFDAADHGDWPQALALAARGQDTTARRLVQWRYLQDRYAKAPFAGIDSFLKAYPDWPRRGVLVVRAEEAMDPAMPPADVVSWFAGRNPISATGEIRLGEALIASGKVANGSYLVREGWANGTFDPAQELAIVQKDGAYLTPDTERRRLDNLIWADATADARREMARVDDATQRLAEVRIDLRNDPQKGEREAAELSADLGSDPRLLFDRARAARRLGDNNDAEALLLRTPYRELIKLHPDAVWTEINADARQALQDGNIRTAYQLVSDTGLTSGNNFSDAEFMAGWIALRKLNDPQAALAHLTKLANGVSRPISLARARYWLGRTYEVLGDTASAWQNYHAAAAAPETFYGQLAMARIDAAPVVHLKAQAFDAVPSPAAFDRDDLVRAMRVLGDLGAQELLRTFALRYQELHPDAGHVKLLAQALVGMGFRDVALRVAKVAGYDGMSFPEFSYPVINVPAYRGPGVAPEPALVLGIIRQETEFDPDSVSHAGARGIMQVMPSSGRRSARAAGIPYRPNLLTDDPGYNMQLGMTEFSGYLGDWNGSLVLSTAAYNAGENNARRWIAAFGDPRSPSVDPIDWIEEIPFTETRNYVQRVIENLEIYRGRLAGRDQTLRILADLYAPNPPPTKVLSYTPPPAPLVPTPKPRAQTASDPK
jgi:peptidoglycan lytic transglycosylase